MVETGWMGSAVDWLLFLRRVKSVSSDDCKYVGDRRGRVSFRVSGCHVAVRVAYSIGLSTVKSLRVVSTPSSTQKLGS
jgi:hypothetical protein